MQKFFHARVHGKIMRKNKRTQKIIEKLSDIILDEMGKEDLTIAEMANKCKISKRKLCDIIYKEDKGLYVETLMTICENLSIDYSDIFE